MADEKRKAKKKGWFYTFGQFLLKLFFMAVYRVRAEGLENVPDQGPVLLCSNHVAVKDPVLLGVVQRRQVFFMAKEELFRNPLIGKVLRGLGAFPVNRGSGGADALAEAYRLLDENAVVGVFLEGHRSKDGQLQKPKTGAALLAYQSKAPVVPVCIASQNGWRPAPFRRTLIKFGRPISSEELSIPDASSMQLRRASRTIMGRIAALREEAFAELGIPALPAPEAEKKPAEKSGEAAEKEREDCK